MNLLSLFKDYLSSQNKPSSKSTIKNYASDLRFFIKWIEKNYSFDFDPKLVNADIIEHFKRSNVDRISVSSLDRHMSSIRKFFLFLSIRAYPFRLRCSEKNFMGFQQVQEFFHHMLPHGVTHLYETAEVLLLQGAM